MSGPMNDDAMLDFMRRTAEAISHLEWSISDLQTDAHVYRLIIGTLLTRASDEVIADVVELHRLAEELTLPFSISDAQTARIKEMLGQMVDATRLIRARRSPSS